MQKDSKIFRDNRLNRLMAVFSSLFWDEYRTRLQGGNPEPFYQAASPERPYNTIYFTWDYVSSALHEVAHWCVAGAKRRAQDDYGYWYAPDGRSAVQQIEFEQVEVVPQAIERIFGFAMGQQFRVSADNLHGALGASPAFVSAIHRQTIDYCNNGLPKRAEVFARALAREFAQPDPLLENHYTLDQLR